MIPYIVILVFIIVMILWIVYGQLKAEGFGDSPSTYTPLVITDETTVADMIEASKKKAEFFKTLKATLDMPTAVLPDFTPQEIGMETLNIAEQEEDGKKFYRGPTEDSPTLLDAFRVLVKSTYEQINAQSNQAPPPDVQLNQTYKSLLLSGFEKLKPDATEEENENAFSGAMDYFNKKEAKEFEIYQRILDANKNNTATNQEESSINDVTQEESSINDVTQEESSINDVTPQEESSINDITQEESSINDVTPQEESSINDITQEESSINDVTQDEIPRNNVATQGTASRNNVRTQGTASRNNVATQGTASRNNVRTQGTASRNNLTTQRKTPVLEINRLYAMVGSSYDNKDKPIKDKKRTKVYAPEAELNTTKPKEKKITDSKPDSAPVCSDKLSKELEDRLAKNITKQLRDDMLLQRALSDVRPSSAPCMADTMPSTNLTQQGYEYQHSKPLDMNDYIRKDSIPCWGCSLPQ